MPERRGTGAVNGAAGYRGDEYPQRPGHHADSRYEEQSGGWRHGGYPEPADRAATGPSLLDRYDQSGRDDEGPMGGPSSFRERAAPYTDQLASPSARSAPYDQRQTSYQENLEQDRGRRGRSTGRYRDPTTAPYRESAPPRSASAPPYRESTAPYRESAPPHSASAPPYRESTAPYQDAPDHTWPGRELPPNPTEPEQNSYRQTPSYGDVASGNYRDTVHPTLPLPRALPARRALPAKPAIPNQRALPAPRALPAGPASTSYREDIGYREDIDYREDDAAGAGRAAYRAGVDDYRFPEYAAHREAPAYRGGGGRRLAALPAARRQATVYDVDEDDELDDLEPGGYLAAVMYTAMWYAVPVVLWVLWSLTLNPQASANCVDDVGVPCASERTAALATLTHAMPQLAGTFVLSAVIALVLRWVSSSWKAATVGFAAAVVGGGLATVGISVITGQPIG